MPGASQCRCTPLALGSSLALLSRSLVLSALSVQAGRCPPLRQLQLMLLWLGPARRECGASLVHVSALAPTLALRVPQRPGHCHFALDPPIPSPLPLPILP